MFDVTSFIDRNGWTIEDLANRLFDKGGTSRVGMWKSGDSSPRYAQILKIIELGATAEELFGKEHAEILLKNSSSSKISDSTENSSDQPIKRFTREEVLSFLSQLSDIAKDETSGSATENSTK